MNNQIYQYIQNQLSRSPHLLRGLSHDPDGNAYVQRHIFLHIKKLLDNFLDGNREIRIIGIPGLRGVGKTTLLAQLYHEVFPQHQRHILYLSTDQLVDILHSNLNEALEEYQHILGVSFERLSRPVFLFIDEVHYDHNWSAVLKSLYDRSKNIFIVCTGSSALSLQSTTDLARRIIFETMYPMSFDEFILLKTKNLSLSNSNIQPIFPVKELSHKIGEILFHSENATDCFNKLTKLQNDVNSYWYLIDQLEIDSYLKFGTLPFTLRIEDEGLCYRLINELIDRVVNKDMLELGKFSADTISKVKNVLFMTAGSDEISITNLAKNLTDISINTLIELFGALEQAEMLIRAYPYGSTFKKVRKPSKYFFMSPALRYTLLGIVEGASAYTKYKGKLLEDVVAFYINRILNRDSISTFYYDSAKGGADFIVQLGRRKIVLEVGFGNKGLGQARSTLHKVKGDYAIVISQDQLQLIEDENIIRMPLEYFLLV